MEENNKKKNKTKVVVISCIIVAVLLGIGGAHVYASTHGYGNVFFLIKYLVTGEKPEITDKNELLSDRDITLSYEPINLTENIKIQIRNIQIKDNKAKLIIGVNEKEKNNTTPLKYKVYNESDKLICDYEGKTQEDSPSQYIEELMLNEFKNDDKILKLEIYNAQNEKLTRIKINLETREITVEGEKEAVNKISEIELKRFLESISALEKYKNSDDEKILFAKSEIASNENLKANGELFDEVNKMLEATGYEKLSNPLKNADYFKITNKNGTDYIEVTVGREGFEPNKVIEIKNISYCGGIYTVNFTYTFIHPSDEFNTNIDDLDIEEATAYIKLNEDKTYSTFKVVKFENGPESKATDKSNNSNNSNNDNTIDINKPVIESEVNNTIEKYLELLGDRQSCISEPLCKLGLIDTESTTHAKKQGYMRTNVAYSKFKEEILKYMTEQCFQNEINIDDAYIDEDGYLCYLDGAGSAHSYSVIYISKVDNNRYKVDTKEKGEEVGYAVFFEVYIVNSNGKNVVQYCRKLSNKEILDIEKGNEIEKQKAISSIKSALVDKNWLKQNTLIKSTNGDSTSIEEQEYKFAVIKEQDSNRPVVVLVVTSQRLSVQNTFIVKLKYGKLIIEKVSEGHMQHGRILTNENHYAVTYEHMGDWKYELKEVAINEIRTIDQNSGKLGQEEYDYTKVENFIKNNNLKEVDTVLNEANLNNLLK